MKGERVVEGSFEVLAWYIYGVMSVGWRRYRIYPTHPALNGYCGYVPHGMKFWQPFIRSLRTIESNAADSPTCVQEQTRIDSCDVFVFILTPQSNNSEARSRGTPSTLCL